ncbi:pancreatic triacylglycerol lipase-like [Limulus polyphemus]|uniref:Pancreatic triacylglycerol lipase-like n=1 Tax=Limulus polyphemus TaxID=6850 RepID=A0ABM1C578_LIMPO|nr:pancreatic triacylglycerol lipase-like [Limulus polyphemus]
MDLKVLCCIVMLILMSGGKQITGQLREKDRTDSTEEDVTVLTRCYDEYGCFSIGEPFLSVYRPINLYPSDPRDIDVHFFLMTRRNIGQLQKLSFKDNSTFVSSTFNPSNPVKIIIHGYLEHGNEDWIQDMVRELLTHDDYNVISVDWAKGGVPPYTQAVANARMVGAIVGKFLQYMEDNLRVSPSDVHIIGHSLGAHAAGYTGERVPGLGRITGLDPAEPYFQYTDPKVRLDPSDAQFIDVIHTDGDSIISGGFGMMQSSGHVDFYPNGGRRQPGCNNNVVSSVQQEGDLYYGIRRFVGCNHIRAYEFFSESINTDCPFFGYKCNSFANFTAGVCTDGCGDGSFCAPMGFKADKWQRFKKAQPVKMYLITGNVRPFCQYHYNIKIKMENSEENRKIGPQRGVILAKLTGRRGQTSVMRTSREPQEFNSGTTYEFLMSSSELGSLLRIDIEWRPVSPFFNFNFNTFNRPNDVTRPLRNMFIPVRSRLQIQSFEVKNLESGNVFVFCGQPADLAYAEQVKTFFKSSGNCTS